MNEYKDDIHKTIDYNETVYQEGMFQTTYSKVNQNAQTSNNTLFSSTLNQYRRVPIQELDQLTFIILDCDYKQNTNQIRLFGITDKQQSLEIKIIDYFPYFYISFPSKLVRDDKDIDYFLLQFNNYLYKNGITTESQAIREITVVESEIIRNYKGQNYQKEPFLKLSFQNVNSMKKAAQLIEKGLNLNGLLFARQTYENKITYPLKFMIDLNLRGMGWAMAKNLKEDGESNCQKCYIAKTEDISPHEDQQHIPNLRIISLDIQTIFPQKITLDSSKEIIVITCVIKINPEVERRIVFTQNKCQEIINTIIIQSENEIDLLKQFNQFFLSFDPDVITGYNLHDEILPLIMQRSRTLGLNSQYLNYGRSKNEESLISNGRFFSTVMRMRETKFVETNGRIQLDTLICMLRDTKISQYSLGSIYYSLFNQQIEIYDQETILQLYEQNNIKRISTYSLRKSEACLEVLLYKGWIYTYAEISKVTGTKKDGYLVPDENHLIKPDTTNLKGALVLEPKKGFYKIPLALFDFVSLYPSIIIAYNMCYTTIIKDYSIKLNEDDYHIIPEFGHKFVKQHIKKGILPQILENLLAKRAVTKQELKQEEDKQKKSLLDARQQALKIAANSIFGFTGCAEHGYLPCLEITQSILRVGRAILQNSISIINNNYPNAEILYGDTDSLLINFKIQNLSDVFNISIEASNLVTSSFPKPIRLSFEKMYNPFLLVCKKRYVGLPWKNELVTDKIEQKGICTVRRDNTQFLKDLLNQVLHEILIEQNNKKAVSIVKEKIQQLLNGEINISNLIISKSLSIKIQVPDFVDEDLINKEEEFHSYPDKYHDTSDFRKQPHVKVAQEKVKNKQINTFQKGDRISYVIVENIPGQQLSENAQDPLEAFKNNYKLNIQYYINQIKIPIIHILEHIIPNPEALFNLNQYQSVPKKSFCNVVQNNGSKKALNKYLKKKITCVNCRDEVPINKPICFNCRSQQSEILFKISQQLINSQNRFQKYNMTCQQCQQSQFDQVICKNEECHTYYKRNQEQIVLQNVWDKYEQIFNCQW
ncbi:unnamed protein product [Paramecium octaurelia]|uniref:DNA polymerase delta catalytic subunit n=1 Tax=Paramecium octaurelia TaxID=43137 RepID=A0A8S1RXL2_PAROT|nr:unnamed protein product [Paramecium octaurelia]